MRGDLWGRGTVSGSSRLHTEHLDFYTWPLWDGEAPKDNEEPSGSHSESKLLVWPVTDRNSWGHFPTRYVTREVVTMGGRALAHTSVNSFESFYLPRHRREIPVVDILVCAASCWTSVLCCVSQVPEEDIGSVTDMLQQQRKEPATSWSTWPPPQSGGWLGA